MQCPQIGLQYRINNKAAIALQGKLNGKLTAALLFIYRIVVLFEDIATLGYHNVTDFQCFQCCKSHENRITFDTERKKVQLVRAHIRALLHSFMLAYFQTVPIDPQISLSVAGKQVEHFLYLINLLSSVHFSIYFAIFSTFFYLFYYLQ